MNWPRLLEVIAKATTIVGPPRKKPRGYQWACYCVVCVELRRLVA